MNDQKKSVSRNSRWLPPVLGGAVCAALTGAAVWFDLTYNGGRLVYPMDSYAFSTTDIPMVVALALDACYLIGLGIWLGLGAVRQKIQESETNRTRKLNPKMGFLGFLGFGGFIGFWSYGTLGDLTPFAFFVFFGFFGFFFEGKMSETLMDERYKENAAKAERNAYRTGFIIIFLLLILGGQASRFKAELIAPVLIIGIALAAALTIFLSAYLLYRYDHDDAAAMEEDE